MSTDLMAFLNSIQPETGKRSFMSKAPNGNPNNVTFNPGEEERSIRWVQNECEHGKDVLYTPATFSDRRLAANAVAVKSIWADIDCGRDKNYPSQDAAQTAVNEWTVRTGLHYPQILVNSGYGIHAYWVFKEAITPDQWKYLADNFKRLCIGTGLSVDHSRTTDIASLMRLPGTWNHKYDQKRLVEIIHFDIEG
jgi:hypothetical protein